MEGILDGIDAPEEERQINRELALSIIKICASLEGRIEEVTALLKELTDR